MVWRLLNLGGRKRWTPPTSERKPINIHPVARARLNQLLFEPEMRAIGYSEFIMRACNEAYQQIDERRRYQ